MSAALADRFVVVSGNIGVGKSTLVGRLGDAVGSVGILEDHEANPYLERFYADPARWAFHVQATFLGLSITDYERATAAAGAVLERTVQERLDVFARELGDAGVLSAEELGVLRRLHEAAERPSLRRPDLLVYLHAPPEVLAERIAGRGQAGESKVSLDYLRGLDARYADFVGAWTECEVLAIDTVELDARAEEGLAAIVDLAAAAVGSGGRR
jgi:deoxyadenosine/deoxycytidine kinase